MRAKKTHACQMLGRREFLAGAAGAWFAGALPTFAAEDGDWGSAFRKLGFDPSGEDCATFVVIGDPHVPWADKDGDSDVIRRSPASLCWLDDSRNDTT